MVTKTRYLLIRQCHKRTGGIWDALRGTMAFDVEELDQKDLVRLREIMGRLRAGHDYERVVFDCNLRNIGSAWRLLIGVERLVIFDNDLYHHYNPRSSYHGLFVAMFKRLQPHRIITTGLFTAQGFEREGLNVSYLPKSYDPALIQYLDTERDIECGFIGRVRNKVYADRRHFLEGLRDTLGLQLLRTEDGPDYNATLNRIRFFVSADHGLNEYMAKNFEAMAAGCVLCTVPTIPEETGQLGFRDMENVVFYDSARELTEKLQVLRADIPRAEAIALAGRRLVELRHSDRVRAPELLALVDAPLAPPPAMGLSDRVALLRLAAYHLVTRG